MAVVALPVLAGIDDPAKPWSYFVHPVTCIGMPLQTARTGIQVTPEGTVFTGEHELALFFGDERKPLACRQRRFVDDMPIVEDEWRDGACQYRWTLFGATLPCDARNENTAVFARLEVQNVGTDVASPKIWASMKASGGFRREGRAPFNAHWRYRFSGDELWRGDEGRERLQVIYPAGAEAKFAALGKPYDRPFTAEEIGIGANTDAGVVLYRPNLKPGEARSFVFRLPRAPTADTTYLAQLRGASFEAEQSRVRDYWQKLLYTKSEILTPGEPKVASIHRQTAAHVLLASRCYGGKPQQTDALPYPMCFLTAQYEYQLLYHDFGWLKMFAAYLDRFTERQQPDGLFVDMSLSHGQKIFCGHGQPLSCICNTVVELGDRKLGEKYFPAVLRAVDCIRNDSDTQPHGLMRASIPYDNEMIKGQYTSHNYWSIIGLRAAIRLADFMGRETEAKAWREFLAKYQALVLKAVRESADPDGYVPTGLYGFITGRAARHGFDEFRTDQDWENEMLLWPTELVQPGDPLVAGTLRRLHATKYREGIMSYRNGQHLHQYITCRAANQSIAEGDARNALIDFYHCIIHSGPAGESFENMIEPWNKRDVEFCPPPHAWGNANCNTLVRNLFLFERGDDTLYVLPALCRAWLKDGEPCGILRAPTRFGEVSVTIVPDARGATLTLDAQWKRAPTHIYFRIPYFVKDWKGERIVELSPSERSRRFEWRIDENADHGLYAEILRRYRREPGHWKGKRSEMPPIPEAKLTPEEERTEIDLSFADVLQAWRHEYALRRGARGEPAFKPVQMSAPSKAERAPRPAGDLLYRAKTTCSKEGERPAAAVDGFMGVKNYGYFECGVNGWWQADMGKVQDVSEITVIPYYRDAKRPYRFVVKTSVDGVNWTLHIDKRGNGQPFGAAGLTEKFQNTPMRYIRVENAGGNTVNKHLHLVEVLAK